MTNVSRMNLKNAVTLTLALAGGAAAGLCAMVSDAATIQSAPDQAALPSEPAGDAGSRVQGTHVQIDRSGHARVGKASFYASRYSGRTMADGTPMKLYSNNAASLTLPLGTTAKVTNLATGKSAVVTIRDRGPYVKGRIIDLSPATAALIGISKKQGLAEVEVKPLGIRETRGDAKLAALASR